jgi:hypothetical protein
MLPDRVREDVFGKLPTRLREELLDAFGKIVQNFSERRWEPSELNGGKLCEIVYSLIKDMAEGKYPPRATKPKNMMLACAQMEQATSLPRSLRVQIPRMIVALYEVRNNRSVGHAGGDVDPNHMDAVCVLQMSKRIMAELVRVLHQLPVDEAAEIVDALVERESPLIWKVNDKTRVLGTKLSMKDKALVLLHATAGSMDDRELIDFVEHSNASTFRRDVLRPAHKTKLIEYDEPAHIVTISPLGIEHVENLLAQRTATG